MKVIARKVDWVKYNEAIGDHSGIHLDDDYARSKGLEGAIAPAMWLASLVQGKHRIIGAGPMKFREPVYDGTVLNFKKTSKDGVLKYEISSEAGVHCNIMNVRRRGGKRFEEDSRDPIFVYETDVTPEKVGLYLESLHRRNMLSGHLPEMYFASLSAPALLAYGKESGKIGIHGTQSFYLDKPVEMGDVQVYVKEGKRPGRGGVETFELEWMQNGDLLAKGSSSVLPIDN